MTNEKIARINELAKKSKTTGLTDAEKAEQAGPAAGVCCGRKGQPARPAEQHLDQRAGWHCAQAGEEELKQHHEEERPVDN